MSLNTENNVPDTCHSRLDSHHLKLDTPTMVVERALIEQLHEFETPLVSEALGAMGCPDAHLYYMGGTIRRLIDTPQPMVGVAITLEVDTSSPGRPVDSTALYDAYDSVKNWSVPAVLVIKTIGSRPDHECVLGDGIAKASLAAGCCGVLVGGLLVDGSKRRRPVHLRPRSCLLRASVRKASGDDDRASAGG